MSMLAFKLTFFQIMLASHGITNTDCYNPEQHKLLQPHKSSCASARALFAFHFNPASHMAQSLRFSQRSHATFTTESQRRATLVCNAANDKDSEYAKEFSDVVERKKANGELDDVDPEMEMFNNEAYEQLRQSSKFEEVLQDKEMWQSLQGRINENEALYSSIKSRPTKPQVGQTPGEVIEIVLLALQQTTSDPPAYDGLRVLMNYCSQASACNEQHTSVERLGDYFSTSKYRILMQWDQIMFSKVLDVGRDGDKACQTVRLRTGADQEWVTVTFSLCRHELSVAVSDSGVVEGAVWLIDGFRVKQDF